MHIANPVLPLLLAGTLLLSACGGQDPVSGNNAPAATESPDLAPGVAELPFAQADGDNLLPNPAFSTNSNGLIEDWSLTMHASNTSYAVRVENDVAIIERIENEPWGGLKQQIGREQMSQYLGQRLQVSVEAMGRFNDSFGEAFQPAGLTVYLWGAPPGQSRRTLLQEFVDPVALGDTDWRTLVVEFDVPGPDSTAFVELEIFLLHTHGGELLVRKPRLVVL